MGQEMSGRGDELSDLLMRFVLLASIVLSCDVLFDVGCVVS